MHFGTLVVLREAPKNEYELNDAVARAMKPGEGGHWDWYQIGGRWTGALDAYKPEEDPENIQPCKWCLGTGKRKDMVVENGCNGCGGTGKHVKWPTEWKRYEGDIVSLMSLTDGFAENFYWVVVEEHGFFSSERYCPTVKWLREKFPNSPVDGHRLLVVVVFQTLYCFE
jgi:hypothetical protein